MDGAKAKGTGAAVRGRLALWVPCADPRGFSENEPFALGVLASPDHLRSFKHLICLCKTARLHVCGKTRCIGAQVVKAVESIDRHFVGDAPHTTLYKRSNDAGASDKALG